MATKLEKQTWPDLFAIVGDRNSAVIWEGPSRIDGAPIMVVASGLWDASSNSKTGAMVQTVIIRADVDPVTAIRQGSDASICGGCPLRSVVTGEQAFTSRACYVSVAHAPLTAYKVGTREGSPRVALSDLPTLGRDKRVRLGTYGDPAAVPIEVWDALLSESSGWTGYTHQWRAARLRDVLKYCQASCDTAEDVEKARRAGAVGTFRVGAPNALEMLPDEILCPASAEAGKVTSCDRCGMCQGAAGRNIYIPAHGPTGPLLALSRPERAALSALPEKDRWRAVNALRHGKALPVLA